MSLETSQKCPEGNTKTSGRSFRHFAFTSFSPVRSVLMDWMRYLIAGAGVCPTTKKTHWQCHVYSNDKISLKQAIKRLAPCHVEVAMNPEKSIEYCKKDGDFVEFGDSPKQGARNDLVLLVNSVMTGAITVDDIVCDNPDMFHKYGRTLERAADIANKKVKRDFMPTCIWLYGPTGTGKTRSINDAEPDLYWYPYENAGWWDNYNGQDAIIFDDFRGQLPLNALLRLCDRYDYTVSRRGRAPIPMLAKRIYFTSCKRPEDIYDKEGTNGDSVAQLLRRVEVRFIDGVFPPPPLRGGEEGKAADL